MAAAQAKGSQSAVQLCSLPETKPRYAYPASHRGRAWSMCLLLILCFSVASHYLWGWWKLRFKKKTNPLLMCQVSLPDIKEMSFKHNSWLFWEAPHFRCWSPKLLSTACLPCCSLQQIFSNQNRQPIEPDMLFTVLADHIWTLVPNLPAFLGSTAEESGDKTCLLHGYRHVPWKGLFL